MRHASPAKQAAHTGHGGGAHDEHGGMKGFLGPYSMTREGSGTSWVPDTTPHEGEDCLACGNLELWKPWT